MSPLVVSRSTFVTILASTFIALAGIAVIGAFFQVLIVVVFLIDAEISASVAREPNVPDLGRALFSICG